MPRNSCTSPPASASGLRLGTYRVQGRTSRAFRVQGLRPCPLQLDQSHVGSLTLAERPQDPRRVLPVATLLAGAPGPASRSPPL